MNEYYVITNIIASPAQWWPSDKVLLVVGSYADAEKEAKKRDYERYNIVALSVFNEYGEKR